MNCEYYLGVTCAYLISMYVMCAFPKRGQISNKNDDDDDDADNDDDDKAESKDDGEDDVGNGDDDDQMLLNTEIIAGSKHQQARFRFIKRLF